MMWLVWQMWVLLLLAAIGGGVAGWILRGSGVNLSSIRLPAKTTPSVPVNTGAGTVSQGGETYNPGVQTSSPDPADTPPATPQQDNDLTAIKGLGPKAAEALKAEGVTRFSQIASWSNADINRFDALLNARGRIARENWVGQARALSEQ